MDETKNEISDSEKQIKMLSQILKIVCDLKDEQETINIKIDLLNGESKRIESAKVLIDERRYISKEELQEKVNIKNWKSWQTLVMNIQSDKDYNIHSGVGRAPTIIVSLKDPNSPVTLASNIFKNMKKGHHLYLENLKNKLKSEALSNEVFKMISIIFPERIKKSQMLPWSIQRIY